MENGHWPGSRDRERSRRGYISLRRRRVVKLNNVDLHLKWGLCCRLQTNDFFGDGRALHLHLGFLLLRACTEAELSELQGALSFGHVG